MRIHSLIFAVALAAGASRADPMAAETAGPRTPSTSIGVAFGLGGNVTQFASSDMKDVTDTGAGWELRATVGTRLFLAGELAYVGSRRNISLSGVSGVSGETPHIYTHGVEALARGQYPLFAGGWLIEPFAFGGLGYTYAGVDGTLAASSPMAKSDDLLIVPFGGGISAAWNGLFLEARFTYRAAFNEDLFKKANGEIASLGNWSAGGLIGYEF